MVGDPLHHPSPFTTVGLSYDPRVVGESSLPSTVMGSGTCRQLEWVFSLLGLGCGRDKLSPGLSPSVGDVIMELPEACGRQELIKLIQRKEQPRGSPDKPRWPVRLDAKSTPVRRTSTVP